MKVSKNNTKARIAKSRGITLIALVVTIVVLIILATISIRVVFGENGIIARAEGAQDTHKQGKEKEENGLGYYEEYIGNYESGNGGAGGSEENIDPDTGWDLNKVNKVTSEDNIVVPVPKEFTASTITGEKSVATGFVIKDGSGNEFVWVPVSDASFANMFKTATPAVALSGSTGVKSNYYSNLRPRSVGTPYPIATVSGGKYSSTTETIREPDLITNYDEDTENKYYEQAGFTSAKAMAEGFVEDYSNMRASIEKYGGFYIGRYELTGTVDTPTVKSGAVLTASPSQAKNWYGLYKACREVKINESVTTTMIWGCQWDETMNWLKNTKFKDNQDAVDVDSSSWGNYRDYNTKNGYASGDANYIAEAGSLQYTGFSSKWSANNIYDLAGNWVEWTQEAPGSFYRISRGGYSVNTGSVYPASARFSDANRMAGGVSTRATLYINL